jgi:hypothetical protein
VAGSRGNNNAHSQESGLDHIEQEIRRKLSMVLRNRDLRGFPLNLPFTDVDEVVTKVSCISKLLLLQL